MKAIYEKVMNSAVPAQQTVLHEKIVAAQHAWAQFQDDPCDYYFEILQLHRDNLADEWLWALEGHLRTEFGTDLSCNRMATLLAMHCMRGDEPVLSTPLNILKAKIMAS